MAKRSQRLQDFASPKVIKVGEPAAQDNLFS